ncbi:MAG: hypothetical protein VKO64_00615 [Candidatus Sericytochromatia bacterium]|nr:hypothetical protein [Candidatus Sericytochromatia bacterium]
MAHESANRPGILETLWGASNRATWGIRERLAFRRRVRGVRPVPRGDLLRGLADPERAALHLDTWLSPLGIDATLLTAEASWARDALDILAALEVAIACLPGPLPDPLRVADIGAKTWHYIRGVHALLSRGPAGPRRVALTGLEIDAFRVYRDFHSRWDWAHWHAAPCPGSRYLALDALAFREPQDLVLLFLPILFLEEHLDWGLSLGQYRPEALFRHARILAGARGHVVMLNFAYEEPLLDRLAEAQEVPPLLRVPAPAALEEGELPRILTVWPGLLAT